MTYEIQTKGLAAFDELIKSLGAAVAPSMALSLNEGARFARRLGSDDIRKEVNLKAGYLNAGRITVTKRADANDLEAVVTAKDRPTSLARFASGTPQFGAQRRAPRVRVKAAGGGRTIKKGFYLRLRRGNSAISPDNFNVGLAIRLKPGERVESKTSMAHYGGGVYLLYGPSTGQVYRSVAERNAEDVGIFVANRLAHHLGRRLDG